MQIDSPIDEKNSYQNAAFTGRATASRYTASAKAFILADGSLIQHPPVVCSHLSLYLAFTLLSSNLYIPAPVNTLDLFRGVV